MSKVLSVQQQTGLLITIYAFKSMENLTFFIGIDTSKATLDWAVVVANKLLFHYQSSNDQKGINCFMKHLQKQCPQATLLNSLYCMEHTGIYNNHMLNFFQHKQANLWLEHPIHIKESLGMIRGKNDKVDAQRIALYARAAAATKIGTKCVYGFPNGKLSKSWTDSQLPAADWSKCVKCSSHH